MNNQFNNQTIMGMPASTFTFVAVAVGFFLFLAFSQLVEIIDPGERGVSVVLGTVDPAVRGEGVLLKIPFAERVFRYSVKQRTAKGEASSYSADLQTVNVEYKTLYRLPANMVAVLHQNFQGDPYTDIVDPLIQHSIKQVVAGYRAEQAVKSRSEVQEKVTALIRLGLIKIVKDLGPGVPVNQPLITLVDLPITNIELTPELEHAIELKQITEQQAQQKSYELLKAKKQAEITIVTASADARALREKSAAIASNPKILDLEMKKLDLEMMHKVLRKWNGQSPKTVVVGADSGANVLLPLD